MLLDQVQRILLIQLLTILHSKPMVISEESGFLLDPCTPGTTIRLINNMPSTMLSQE